MIIYITIFVLYFCKKEVTNVIRKNIPAFALMQGSFGCLAYKVQGATNKLSRGYIGGICWRNVLAATKLHSQLFANGKSKLNNGLVYSVATTCKLVDGAQKIIC